MYMVMLYIFICSCMSNSLGIDPMILVLQAPCCYSGPCTDIIGTGAQVRKKMAPLS